MSTLSPVSPINSRAASMINSAIKPLIGKGCKIDRLQLYVNWKSDIARQRVVRTDFGELRIHSDSLVPKGVAYVIEDPGRVGRGFAWVLKQGPSKKKKR